MRKTEVLNARREATDQLEAVTTATFREWWVSPDVAVSCSLSGDVLYLYTKPMSLQDLLKISHRATIANIALLLEKTDDWEAGRGNSSLPTHVSREIYRLQGGNYETDQDEIRRLFRQNLLREGGGPGGQP